MRPLVASVVVALCLGLGGLAGCSDGGQTGRTLLLMHDSGRAVVAEVPRAAIENDTPGDPGTQQLMNTLTAYLRSLNLPVRDVQVSLASPEEFSDAMAGRPAGFVAYAEVGRVVFNPNLENRLRRFVADWRAGRPPEVELTADLIHEGLHQIRGAQGIRDQYELGQIPTGRWLMIEEGLCEAVAIDLLPRVTKVLFGPARGRKTIVFPGGEVASFSPDVICYRDQVAEVRRRSMRATGGPWHSPAAFAWRVKMLNMTLAERDAEWARAALLPLPTKVATPARTHLHGGTSGDSLGTPRTSARRGSDATLRALPRSRPATPPGDPPVARMRGRRPSPARERRAPPRW